MGREPFNQSELLGVSYGGISAMPVAYTVRDASIWPIKGKGLKSGETIRRVVGKEVDSTYIGMPPALQSFLTSKVMPVRRYVAPRTVGLIFYTTASNSGVIDVSTMGRVCNITDTCTWKGTAETNT